VRPATEPAPNAPAAPPPESARMLKVSPGCRARTRSATAVEDNRENRCSASSVRIVSGISTDGCRSTDDLDSLTAKPAHPWRTHRQTKQMNKIPSRRQGCAANLVVCSCEITRPMHVLAARNSGGSPAAVPSAERTSMVRTMVPRDISAAKLMPDGAGEVARGLAAWRCSKCSAVDCSRTD